MVKIAVSVFGWRLTSNLIELSDSCVSSQITLATHFPLHSLALVVFSSRFLLKLK